jgi:hypothetical protein
MLDWFSGATLDSSQNALLPKQFEPDVNAVSSLTQKRFPVIDVGKSSLA